MTRTIEDRRSASARGYDRKWRKLRELVLSKEPLCRFCYSRGKLTPAVDVDHIVPIAEAPNLRLVEANLRPLCKPCHSGRTGRDKAGKAAVTGCNADGRPLDPEHPWNRSRRAARAEGTVADRPALPRQG